MRRRWDFLLLMTLAAAVSTPALGQDRSEPQNLHIAATTGQQVRVHGHVRFAHNCSPDTVADMTIVTPPKLGELSTMVESVTATRFTPPFRGNCLGHRTLGRVVYYTAQTCGHDTFHYLMSSLGRPTTDWVVTVDVTVPNTGSDDARCSDQVAGKRGQQQLHASFERTSDGHLW
jgi:hypothetical protein